MQNGNSKTSTWATLKSFLRQNGPGALFTRGLFPSLVGVTHGAAQFIIYDHIKAEMAKRKQKGEKLVSKGSFTLRDVAKTCDIRCTIVSSRLIMPWESGLTRTPQNKSKKGPNFVMRMI